MTAGIRAFFVLGLVVFEAGCSNQTLPARSFAVRLEPEAAGTAVAVLELVEQTGSGDCPRFDPERVLSATVVESDANGRLVIAKPAAHSDVWLLGMRRRERFARWTIYRPGFVVTTVYPEGRDVWDSGVDVGAALRARVGWCAPSVVLSAPYSEMGPNQEVGAGYGKGERVVALTVKLRRVSGSAERLWPDPDWRKGPVVPPAKGLCRADAETLRWQVNQLEMLEHHGDLREVSAAARRAMVLAIEAEDRALGGEGVGGEWGLMRFPADSRAPGRG